VTPGEDVRSEERVFLDPLDPDDALLIDFDENGVPIPAVDGWHAERVLKTRDLLHLDAIRMVEARQSVWRECEELVLLIATSLEVPSGEYRPRDREAAQRALALLHAKLRPDAPLSAVAQAYVLKCPHRWARRVILHPLSQIGVAWGAEGSRVLAAPQARADVIWAPPSAPRSGDPEVCEAVPTNDAWVGHEIGPTCD